jgi:alkanesulfonate monooxygenase SsuD/methylene tetrahydromethanopterin reductase-like flavin-dependent oxidoreductase (luciferase family)
VEFYFFHLMPWPYLPPDFVERHPSSWVTYSNEAFDPARGHHLYNRYLDELEYAETLGFDGICVNEHHQTAYGLMPAPNVIAAMLARRTSRARIAILGNAISLRDHPIRVAEEVAMLDVISGGRIISGFVRGTGMEYYSYGANPAYSQERFWEAHDLIIKAWTEPGPFHWQGKHYNLPYVNPWPRPLQQPHPPIWVPGGGSIETWDWTLDKGYLYAYLSYSGYKRGKLLLDGFWQRAEAKNVEPNPYHAGFLQLVAVADSEAEVDEKYAPHGEYFYNKMLHVYPGFAEAPGYRTLDTIKLGLLGQTTRFADRPPSLTWNDLREQGNIIAGTPKQVVEQLEHVIKSLHVGHLMLLNQFGSMPHELAEDNIRLMGEQVLPKLRGIWDGEWQDRWWIKPVARVPALV